MTKIHFSIVESAEPGSVDEICVGPRKFANGLMQLQVNDAIDQTTFAMAATLQGASHSGHFRPENFKSSQLLLLSVRGSLSLDEFVEACGESAPEDAQLSFAAWTAPRAHVFGTKDWDAFVLTRKSIKSPKDHFSMSDKLLQSMKDAGIDVDHAGLDRAALSPFYIVSLPWRPSGLPPGELELHNISETGIARFGL